MDPLSILGAAASAITVVELCTESLNSLLRLQYRYTNADLTVRLLITQLCTLRTALSQISEWNVDTVPHHVQTDLDMSLDGCKFLIQGLNDHLSRIEYDENKALSVRKKAQLLWGEKERTDFLTLLSHNIAALQLLLTAMQCRAQSEQTILLQKSENRQIIQSARDDTSSLLWLRDDESRGTRKSTCTENSELLDASFTFDREIFSSKAYLAAMRSNMKHIVRGACYKAQDKHTSRGDVEQEDQSEEDALTVTEDAKELQEQSDDLQVPAWLEFATSRARTHDNGPHELRRRPAADSVTGVPDWNLRMMEQPTCSRQGSIAPEKAKHGPKRPDQAARRLIRMPSLLKSRSSTSSQTSLDLSRELRTSRPAAHDEAKLLLIGNTKSSGSTILQSMELAYGDRYSCTEQNMSSIEDDGIRETFISRNSAGVRYNYRIYDVVGLHSKENKWIYSFDEMSTMIYVVDISAYNLAASDDRPSNCVQEDLALFQQICSSSWLVTTPILLLLSSFDILKSKLRDFPLQDHFQDYVGSSTDVAAARSFFRQKFLSLNKKYDMRIRVVFTDSVATVKLGKAIVANIDKILTEGTVLAFGSREMHMGNLAPNGSGLRMQG